MASRIGIGPTPHDYDDYMRDQMMRQQREFMQHMQRHPGNQMAFNPFEGEAKAPVKYEAKPNRKLLLTKRK